MESAKKEDSKVTDKTVEKPADKTAEKADNQKVEKPADKTNGKTTDDKTEKPADVKPDKTEVEPKPADTNQNKPAEPVRYEDPARRNDDMEDNVIKQNENGTFDYSDSETYQTKRGDTLFSIAQEHKVALQQLRYFNNLPINTESVPLGVEIHIPSKFVDVPVGK